MINGYQIIDYNKGEPIEFNGVHGFSFDGRLTGKPLYVTNYKEVQEGYDDVTFPYTLCFHDGDEEDSEGVYNGFRISDSGHIRHLFTLFYDDEIGKIIITPPAN